MAQTGAPCPADLWPTDRGGGRGLRTWYQAAATRMARSFRSLGLSLGSCLMYVSLGSQRLGVSSMPCAPARNEWDKRGRPMMLVGEYVEAAGRVLA